MRATNPYGLPHDLLDAAMAQLVGRSGEEWNRTVATLLAAHPEHADALGRLAVALLEADSALAATYNTSAVSAEPQFDGYRVLRKLGEGAFGVVYLGEQDEPVRREVAIKVLRPGAGDRATLARFDAERRFLARLRHPAIAQIFGAGLLADGRPWFVMEYVPGVPIAPYCDQNRLSVVDRVRLFARLCQGVQHAHEQGVVHRDLKPANILVVEVDGEAQPKIIDFGIARALLRPADHDEARTEAGRVVGTPGYMSPEQMEGNLAAIDARSDVWSLGVVLYELLTGELPWGKRPTSTDSDPPRPSSRIGTMSVEGATTAQLRNTQPRRLAAQLRGELDWIVLKALSREREGRYTTALELAADVHRHLRGEPVQAGPPSWRYRLHKFGRRHRVALALAGGLGLAAATAVGTSAHFRAQARVSEQLRLEATHHAAARLLERAGDARLDALEGGLALREELAREAMALQERFDGEMDIGESNRQLRLETLLRLAEVCCSVGKLDQASRMASSAVEQAESACRNQPDAVAARCNLAWAHRTLALALYWRGEYAQAAPHCHRALADLEFAFRQDPAASTDQLVKSLEMGWILADRQNDDAAALTHCLRALAVLEGNPPLAAAEQQTRRQLLRVHAALARFHFRRDDATAARASLATAQHVLATWPIAGDESLAEAHLGLADALANGGLRDEARAAYAAAAAKYEVVLRKNPMAQLQRARYCVALQGLARSCFGLGRGDEGMIAARGAIQAAEEMPADFESCTARQVDQFVRLARAVVLANSTALVGEARTWLDRAEALLPALPGNAQVVSRCRSQVFLCRAQLDQFAGIGVPIATWEQALALADAADADFDRFFCCQAMVDIWLRQNDLPRARTAMAQARYYLQRLPTSARTRQHRVNLERQAWRIERAANDHAAVAAIAEALLDPGADWEALKHGADGMKDAAWLARQAGRDDLAATYEEVLVDALHRLVAATMRAAKRRTGTHEVLAHGFAQLDLAAMLDETNPEAIRLRREGLEVLASLRATAQRSWWDRTAWAFASVLRAKDLMREGDLESGAERLEALHSELDTAVNWITAGNAWAECGRLAQQADASDQLASVALEHALDAVAEAVRRGATKRLLEQRLTEMRLLAQQPRFATLWAGAKE